MEGGSHVTLSFFGGKRFPYQKLIPNIDAISEEILKEILTGGQNKYLQRKYSCKYSVKYTREMGLRGGAVLM